VNLADVKARMAVQLTACPRPSLFYSGRTLPNSVESATHFQIGDDINEPGHGLQLLDRPSIEGGIRADKPACGYLIVAAGNCIERAKQLHEKNGKLERLRAGLKVQSYRA
jgi:hypothetical protein